MIVYGAHHGYAIVDHKSAKASKYTKHYKISISLLGYSCNGIVGGYAGKICADKSQRNG